MLGPKIDARLNTLERKLADLTHRLERLEQAPAAAKEVLLELPVVTLPEESAVYLPNGDPVPFDAPVVKRRGRPPKAKNG